MILGRCVLVFMKYYGVLNCLGEPFAALQVLGKSKIELDSCCSCSKPNQQTRCPFPSKFLVHVLDFEDDLLKRLIRML